LVAAVAGAAWLPLFSGAVSAAKESIKDSGKVDDSARGDEPAEPKARPSETRADTSLREPVVDAIPTIAPHSPRQPSQTPPWPEETITVDTAGDVQTEEHNSSEPSSEVPVGPIIPEPSPPPAEIADDGSHETRAVDPASEVPVQPVAPESATPVADSDVGSRETQTTELETEAAAEPAVEDLSSTAGSPLPEQLESEVSAPIVGEAPVEPAPAPLVRPEVDTESDAAPPFVPDVIILPPPPSQSADPPAQSDGPVSAVSTPDELIWLDAPEALQPAETTEAEGTAHGIDTPPSGEQPVPIREDQIWSGPETVEPRIEPEQTEAQPQPPAERDARAEPQPAAEEEHTPPASRVEAAPPSALSLPLIPSSLTPAWPSTSLQPPGSVDEAVPYLRLAVRAIGGVVLALTAIVLLLVVLYRWVDPPASTLMLGQRLTGTEIEQTWRPIERISPHLVQAVILSEDGAFCRHRGVDWTALEEAIESSRGGSTITMQVVKNLFLWPARSYIRKALEIMLAYVVEVVWSKERVLEIYLNIAEWGPGVFGAEAAARNHFGKAASQLTAQEAALLAVSLPSPIERQAGYPDQQTRRLASNLLLRMRAVRTAQRCVRVRRAGN
jgi:monofunctional glycosyltransferase